MAQLGRREEPSDRDSAVLPIPITYPRTCCTRHTPPGLPSLAPQGSKKRGPGGKPPQGSVQAGTAMGSMAQGSTASPGLCSQLGKPAAR